MFLSCLARASKRDAPASYYVLALVLGRGACACRVLRALLRLAVPATPAACMHPPRPQLASCRLRCATLQTPHECDGGGCGCGGGSCGILWLSFALAAHTLSCCACVRDAPRTRCGIMAARTWRLASEGVTGGDVRNAGVVEEKECEAGVELLLKSLPDLGPLLARARARWRAGARRVRALRCCAASVAHARQPSSAS